MATAAEKLIYTVPQAGELLGISRGLAYQLAKEGKIPVIKLGKRLVVPKLALQKLLSGEGKP